MIVYLKIACSLPYLSVCQNANVKSVKMLYFKTNQVNCGLALSRILLWSTNWRKQEMKDVIWLVPHCTDSSE